MQHSRVEDLRVCPLLAAIFASYPSEAKLFSGSAAVFRRRWDKALLALGIGRGHDLTPAGLRGGGACHDFEQHSDIARLMWRMRIGSQETLAHYLQEVAAQTFAISFPETAKATIRSAAESFVSLASLATERLQCDDRRPLSSSTSRPADRLLKGW